MYICIEKSKLVVEEAIEKRYNSLAEVSCCLSCGSALEMSNPAQDEVCVDMGCGRGTDVIRLAEKVGPGGFVYGIDATPGMIRKGQSIAGKLGVRNVEFILSDLEEIPLPDNIADLIISNCVLNHVHNKENAWKEIFRLLKAGGRFFISDIYSSEPVPAEYKSDPAAIAECWAGAVTRDQYLTSVKSAGFLKVNILEESAPYRKGKIEVSSFTLSSVREQT